MRGRGQTCGTNLTSYCIPAKSWALRRQLKCHCRPNKLVSQLVGTISPPPRQPFINFVVSCPCTDLSYSPIHLFTYPPTNQQSPFLPTTLPNVDVIAIKAPQLHHRKLSCTALHLPHLPTLPSTQYTPPLPITPSHPAENSRKYLPEDTPDHVRYMQQRLYNKVGSVPLRALVISSPRTPRYLELSLRCLP